MAPGTGKFQHYKNENVDEYFRAVGVPYIPRKMMQATSPLLEIQNEGDEWSVKTISLFRTVEQKFKLGEEYTESMPSGVEFKSVTTLDGDKLQTDSETPMGTVHRIYEFTDEELVLTMKEDKTNVVAKRYFKKLS